MDMMFLPLRRYADFSGRSRRQEFWMFFLFQMAVNVVFFAFIAAFGTAFAEGTSIAPAMLAIVWVLWVVAMIVPNAAIIVRRFHDQNISGWVGGLLYVSIIIFSFVSALVLIIFMCIEGRRGPNQYGPDPKDERAAQDIFN